ARACLEREAYRQLAHLHAERELDIAAFREAKREIEEGLQQEFARLEQFLGSIRRANEPTVSYQDGGHGWREVLDYAVYETAERPMPLLESAEFEALSLPKGCLTPEERREIESHVVDSYSFLILIPWTRDLAGVPTVAHGHHEKLDGSGYPMGLRGDQIN